MPDPRLLNLARVLVDYSVEVKEGDQVVIRADAGAAPLVREIYRRCVQCGAHILPMISLPGLREIFLKEGSDAQLRYLPPVDQYVIEHFDVMISVEGETNTRELSGVDPARQAANAQGRRTINQTFMERAGRGELRWNVALQPTDAYAQEADMSLADFEDFVYAACLGDQPDPVAGWQEVKAASSAWWTGWTASRKSTCSVPAPTCASASPAGPSSIAMATRTCPMARSSPGRKRPR